MVDVAICEHSIQVKWENMNMNGIREMKGVKEVIGWLLLLLLLLLLLVDDDGVDDDVHSTYFGITAERVTRLVLGGGNR